MRIRHGRLTLEVHELAPGVGPALLLLHALYGSSADWGGAPAEWAGPVFALDFAGHGKSDWVAGGVYYPENIAANIDAVLQHIGAAVLAGAGIGGYFGLLVAGGRPQLVPAVLLMPGAGLDGGGPSPNFDAPLPDLAQPVSVADGTDSTDPADPMVRLLETFVRPVEYVTPFADATHRVLLVEDGTPRPPWWDAVRRSRSAEAVVLSGREANIAHLLRVALPRLVT